MNIFIIGSGGREHALAWKILQSDFVNELFVAPGNGGTAEIAQNIPIKETEIKELVLFAQNNDIDLVIVGPEVPLSMGITDAMEAKGILCFGPSKACARLEASKAFSKEIMREAHVPTATSSVFTNIADALAFVMQKPCPLVVKADGLAAGKGVIIAHDQNEVVQALEYMFDGAFGDAGDKVVIEEFLEGEEVSLLCFCDGTKALPLPSAQDHKTIDEGDTGLNTGGMGAYSPAPILPDDELEKMTDLTVRPILDVMKKRGTPFKGILYAGLMMTAEGVRVLEYNVRFGDPECQALMMRLDSDLVEILLLCAKGSLGNTKLKLKKESALGVVVTAKGYPEAYPKGMQIKGIKSVEQASSNVRVFQAGTIIEGNNLCANGGRVLCVTALGDTLLTARADAYMALSQLKMENSYYRKDIGAKGINRIHKIKA